MIRTTSDPGSLRLRQPSSAIALRTDTDKLCDALLSELTNDDAVGVAAPQIGHQVRAFAYDLSDTIHVPSGIRPSGVALNPFVVDSSSFIHQDFEQCLSIPGRPFLVSRPSWVRVIWFSPSWERYDVTLDGFAARVFQHEIDHLDGVLIDESSKRVLYSTVE